MKPHLLLIGGTTPRTMAAMEESFTVHAGSNVTEWDRFLDEFGPGIVAVATNGHDGLKPEIMARLPALKVISCYGVGYDAIDARTAARQGIIVTHTPNVLNRDVANTAILLMLAVSRRLLHDDRWVRSGKWRSVGNAPLTRSIEGSKVGILGLGRIGETIAQKLKAAFDCEISYHSRNEKAGAPYRYHADLEAMAREVDTLIVITPGGAATHKLVNRKVLDALGPQGTLINVSRGTVVDERELVAALLEGRLGAAGLDVFEHEPHVPEELFPLDNVVLLPHAGSATEETRRAMGDLMVENLVRMIREGTVTTPVPECAHLVARG
ncbi:MAG: 2-hydroxyacid dehydrogenase [Nitratireductor sp.]|nr:2-hydroxyacid dehydrogenase [Nitratireductor sp.]